MTAPLLNEYKWDFARKRYASTMLGGIRLPPKSVSRTLKVLIWIISLILLFCPAIFSVYFTWCCSSIGRTCLFSPEVSSILFGAAMFFSGVMLHAGLMLLKRYTICRHSIMEDESTFEDLTATTALLYIFQYDSNQKDLVRHIVQSLIMGGYLGFVTYVFRLDNFRSVYTSETSSGVLFSFSWVGICLANYSLLVTPPYEINSYHTFDPWNIDIFSRPFHVLTIGVLWVFEKRLNSTVYTSLIQVAGYILASLPALWCLGIMPSIRVSAMVIIELIHVLFGGSPCLTWSTGLLRLVLTILVVLPTYLLATNSTSSTWVYISVIGASFCGSQIFNPKSIVRDPLGWSYLLARMAISGLVLFLSVKQTISNNQQCFYVLLGLLFGRKLLREFQQVLIPSIVPLFYLRQRNQYTDSSKVISLIHQTLYHLLPYAILSWTISYMFNAGSNDSFTQDYDNMWSVAMAFRSFHWLWISPESAGMDVVLAKVGDYVFPCDGLSSFPNLQWCTAKLGTKLFIMSLVTSTITQIFSKTWVFSVGTFYFLTNQKSRHPDYVALLIPILLLSPVTIIFTSILNMPSMSFLGLPLLLPAFWRPLRMTTSIYEPYLQKQEGAIYSALMPSLARELGKANRSGQLPNLDPGDFLVVRLQSMLILFYAIESSFETIECIATGLEVEPTSCHALEGVELDQVLNDTLEKTGSEKSFLKLNKHMIHTLLPLGSLTCEGYVESRQSTAGLLDSPVLLRRLPLLFMKIFSFDLLSDSLGDRDPEFMKSILSQDILTGFEQLFPYDWIEFLHDHRPDMKLPGSFYKGDVNRRITSTVSCWLYGLLSLTPSQLQSPGFCPISTSTVFSSCKGEVSLGINPRTRKWMLSKEAESLRVLAISSMRKSVRILYEEGVDGDIYTSNQLLEKLNELASDWLITIDPGCCSPTDPTNPSKALEEAIQNKLPNIMMIMRNQKESAISIRMLELKLDNKVLIGKLNGEAIRAIWSNLVFELLYLTNDDDERYSIQVHKLLLRNITVQAAQPPFGYPVYVSPVRISKLPAWMDWSWWKSKSSHLKYGEIGDGEFATMTMKRNPRVFPA